MLVALVCGCGGALAVGAMGASAGDPQETVTFASTGEHPFTVPPGVGTLTVRAVGGKGGDAFVSQGLGGFGAEVIGHLSVSGGEPLYAEVAGDGENGTLASGGTGAGAGGGGASDIRTSPAAGGLAPDPRLIVAGGGGGGGGGANCGSATGGPGGAAGHDGSPGTGITSCNRSAGEDGRGGLAPVGSAGGSGGGGGTDALFGRGGDGSTGQLGTGGDGGQAAGGGISPASGGFGGGGAAGLGASSGSGGGGGGGLYGGGGGGGGGGIANDAGGGGGGSNLVPAGGTATTDTTGTPRIVVSFTDTTAPAVTLSAVPSPSTTPAPILSGTGSTALGDEPAVSVNLYRGASGSGTPIQTLSAPVDPASGAYSVAVFPALTDGTYSARASQADQAGLVGISATRPFVVAAAPPGSATPASPPTPPSKVELFGHLGYVSPSGVAGVFVGCFGPKACTGSLTIKEGGRIIARRASETIGPDDGGIAHVRLIASARRALTHGRLTVTVIVADVDGPHARTRERLVPFDTTAAIAGIERAFATSTPSGIKVFGHTGFVNAGGTTGVFLGCFGTTQCAGAMTLTADGAVVGGRGAIYVSPNDGIIVHVTLRRAGRRLLAEHHRLTVTVTVTERGGSRAVARVTLVPYFGDIDDYALVTSPARVGASSTTGFDLALTNASSPGLYLGSARLTPPAGFKLLTASMPPGTRGQVSVTRNAVVLGGLHLGPGATLHVTVTALAPARCRGSSSKWTSAAWEGQRFDVQALTLDKSRSTSTLTLKAPCTVRFLTEPANATVGQHITGTAYDPQGKPVSIAVVDGAGKVVTSSSASVTIGVDSNPGKATLGGTKTVRAVHGVATFDDLTLSKPGNGYTLTASGSKLRRAATSRSFDESSTSMVCAQDGGCKTSLTRGASSFLVIANPDPTRPNSGTLSESVNAGKPLQCPGYVQEDPNSWEFEMSSSNRSKTIVSILRQFILPLQGALNAILQLTQVCFGSTSDFLTSSGTLAPAATLPDGTSGFVGLLPNCPSGPPCVVARESPLDLNNNIGFDIVVTVSIPEGFAGDPWFRV